MGEIQYKKIDADCFNTHSLDSFVRHQVVTECWNIHYIILYSVHNIIVVAICKVRGLLRTMIRLFLRLSLPLPQSC